MKHFAFAIAALCLAACGQPKTVLVQGIGSVERDPEFATIRAEISADADTVDTAVAESSRRVEAVTKGLKDFGVNPESVHAHSFGVKPKCGYDSAGRDICHGYESSHVLSIEVSGFDRLGIILGALAKLGVDRIDDTNFDVRDEPSLKDEARRRAIEDAKAKALLYAEANGLTLDGILGIEDREAAESAYSRLASRVGIYSVPVNAPPEIVVTGSRITRVPLAVQKVKDEEAIYMEFALAMKK
ncbi:MAG: SIMPL domain-containing protein [Alphaproteobacteria bacterium]